MFALHPPADAPLFVMGHGFSTRRYSDVYAYDLHARRWSRLYDGNSAYTPHAPHARCLTAAAAVAPGRLVMYGGCMTVRAHTCMPTFPSAGIWLVVPACNAHHSTCYAPRAAFSPTPRMPQGRSGRSHK
jgi:hypothetical protein